MSLRKVLVGNEGQSVFCFGDGVWVIGEGDFLNLTSAVHRGVSGDRGEGGGVAALAQSSGIQRSAPPRLL